MFHYCRMEDKEKPDFPRRVYSLNEDPFPERSINYCSSDTKLFHALEKCLKKDEWAEIDGSRLGVFLKFWKLKFGWASRLVHYVLGFQVECDKTYEIWSLIGANPIRFSLYEFEHLTGLNCEYVNDAAEDVELTDEMKEFWTKLGVHVETGPSVEALTIACSKCKTWSREERIRLGYLAILAGYIIAHNPSHATPVHLARLF